MFFIMQNMLVGERLRIFRVKNTFFQNQKLSVFHRIWLVFGQWHFDFWWVRDGISARHSEPWLLSGYMNSGLIQWKKKLHFSQNLKKTENCFVILVESVWWVIVTAGVNQKGGKKLNNTMWPLALTSIKNRSKIEIWEVILQ